MSEEPGTDPEEIERETNAAVEQGMSVLPGTLPAVNDGLHDGLGGGLGEGLGEGDPSAAKAAAAPVSKEVGAATPAKQDGVGRRDDGRCGCTA